MQRLIRELIPHAPNIGLYVAPDIPDRMLDRALSDYGGSLQRDDVLVLYDATRLGTGGDGALFAAHHFAFQNTNLERGQTVKYSDIVGVQSRRRFLGGRYIEVQVNRGRATVPLRIDFSARPEAADYVTRFLREAMLYEPPGDAPGVTEWKAVESALRILVSEGRLTTEDMEQMLDIGRRKGGL